MKLRAALLALLIATPALGDVRVLDGDTIAVDGQRLRLAGIDAPELRQYGARPKPLPCEVDKAHDAKDALSDALLRAGDVEIVTIGIDFYRRPLVVVYVDGLNLNRMMIAWGQARDYRPNDDREWC